MLVRQIESDDLDFGMDAMGMARPAMRTGRLVRPGEQRFLVRRLTDAGRLVTMASCATMDQAQHVCRRGEFIEVLEVGA